MQNDTIYDAWWYAVFGAFLWAASRFGLAGRGRWQWAGYAWALWTEIAALIHFVIARAETKAKSLSMRARHTRERRLGTTYETQVTVLGCGGASLGDLYVRTPHAQAVATVERAAASGIRFFDTAPFYGLGLSEARMGLALQRFPRDSFVLNTKVGRTLVPDRAPLGGDAKPGGWRHGAHFTYRFDYSGAGFRQQHADSLMRTGLGRVDTLVIHDLEPVAHKGGDDPTGEARAATHLEVLRASGFDELCAMRGEGTIVAFGAGVNAAEDGEDAREKVMYDRKYVGEIFKMGDARPDGRGVDFLLLANLYSLLNHDAHTSGILDECQRRGVRVVVGGPFSSGILATGADPPDGQTPYYNYQPAPPDVRDRCRAIEKLCAKYRVPLAAAALQFPLGHRAVASVIPGAKSPEEMAMNMEHLKVEIPDAFWDDLLAAGLLPRDTKTP